MVAAQMQQERLCSVSQLHAAGPHASGSSQRTPQPLRPHISMPPVQSLGCANFSCIAETPNFASGPLFLKARCAATTALPGATTGGGGGDRELVGRLLARIFSTEDPVYQKVQRGVVAALRLLLLERVRLLLCPLLTVQQVFWPGHACCSGAWLPPCACCCWTGCGLCQDFLSFKSKVFFHLVL